MSNYLRRHRGSDSSCTRLNILLSDAVRLSAARAPYTTIHYILVFVRRSEHLYAHETNGRRPGPGRTRSHPPAVFPYDRFDCAFTCYYYFVLVGKNRVRVIYHCGRFVCTVTCSGAELNLNRRGIINFGVNQSKLTAHQYTVDINL